MGGGELSCDVDIWLGALLDLVEVGISEATAKSGPTDWTTKEEQAQNCSELQPKTPSEISQSTIELRRLRVVW